VRAALVALRPAFVAVRREALAVPRRERASPAWRIDLEAPRADLGAGRPAFVVRRAPAAAPRTADLLPLDRPALRAGPFPFNGIVSPLSSW